jgi:hypothetical protein
MAYTTADPLFQQIDLICFAPNRAGTQNRDDAIATDRDAADDELRVVGALARDIELGPLGVERSLEDAVLAVAGDAHRLLIATPLIEQHAVEVAGNIPGPGIQRAIVDGGRIDRGETAAGIDREAARILCRGQGRFVVDVVNVWAFRWWVNNFWTCCKS